MKNTELNFSQSVIDSRILSIKEEYNSLTTAKEKTGLKAASWNALAISLLKNEQEAKAEALQDKTVDLLTKDDLRLIPKAVRQAAQSGVLSRETINSHLQVCLHQLVDSGSKHFQELQALVRLLHALPAWKADLDLILSYIQKTTPFKVTVHKKKAPTAENKTESDVLAAGGDSGKERMLTIVRFNRKPHAMYRKRPEKFWNSLRSFKINGADNTKLNMDDGERDAVSLEKAITDKASSADMDDSKRVLLAAQLLGASEETESIASDLRELAILKKIKQPSKLQLRETLKPLLDKAEQADNLGKQEAIDLSKALAQALSEVLGM